ncbi:extracellular solute-binding protein [Synechocystis sp. FACHB-383]|uniref:extracellular solute-binding protein n=1 Tax=Synechocystis sp. FACHB-383 TaxID=2692864 RepID=UPI001683F2D6|nr:extracellular solute-binding protein [Synechocystis sp. FACHB-383]MBD2652081.1 extracellular solute-binding protein [Synechocystis sp. FACHB-383]
MPLPPYSRRHFLQTATALGVATGLGGCWPGQGNGQEVQFLNRSLPPQLISQFQRQLSQGKDLNFKAIANLQSLFENLQTWHNPQGKNSSPGLWGNGPGTKQLQSPAQLVTGGDVWLEKAIQTGLIQPFASSQLSQWSTLPPRWQLLGQRNDQGIPDQAGKIWAIPYRWGPTMIIYRQQPFTDLGWQPTDWSDLWRPELEQRIALVDDPREAIGLTLKKLGYSYNVTNPAAISTLAPALQELAAQVKFYSNQYYLQALLNKDVWLAVGWSSQIIPLLRNQSELRAIIPTSGTSLWADLWTMPAGSEAADITYDWLNFSAQQSSLTQMATFSQGLAVPYQNLDIASLTTNPLLAFSPELLERCEFLAPLDSASADQYKALWQTMRSAQTITG